MIPNKTDNCFVDVGESVLYDDVHHQILQRLDRLSGIVRLKECDCFCELAAIRTLFRQDCEFEESLMQKVGFPYIHAHILAHTILSKFFIRIAQINSGPCCNKYSVINLIDDINEHIDTYDAQFSEFLANRN